jgi:hypothetical protein
VGAALVDVDISSELDLDDDLGGFEDVLQLPNSGRQFSMLQ